LTRLFLNGKPLTGYHLYMFSTLLLLVHVPVVSGLARPTLTNESRIVSFFILFTIVEDFLWFVLNPAFGLRRFKRENIWWHRGHWWAIAPKEYFLFGPVALLLYWASYVP
jgi:hypothetical protein